MLYFGRQAAATLARRCPRTPPAAAAARAASSAGARLAPRSAPWHPAPLLACRRPLLAPSAALAPPAFRGFASESAGGLGLGDAPGAARTPRRPQAKRSNGGIGAAAAVGVVGIGAGYAFSSDVRETVDDMLSAVGDAFEDFNDASRELFDRIGDKIVTQKKEPWLLELSTMKYPENIPTLVLDLDKVILLLEHDSRQGWHVVKRPFADQFFREISHYFEVVIFSDDVFPVALEIANKWNLPVTGVLHRDFCKKKRSHYVKDISKLGRSLDRVLIIDHDPEAFQLQPENGIRIRPFTGDVRDSELLDLLEFLKAAAASNQDLRKFVEKFGGGDEDIGRRYLLHKQDQDARVEQRRNLGRAFARGSGFPAGPPGSMSAFPK